MDAPWLFAEVERNASHVKVTVRHGNPGNRALLGHLTMWPAEWEDLKALLSPLPGVGVA